VICHYSHISLYPSPPNSYYASHMVSLTNSIIMNRQPELFVTPTDETSVLNAAIARIKVVLAEHKQPSATELLRDLEKTCGWFVRHLFIRAVTNMRCDDDLTNAQRRYMEDTLSDDEMYASLRDGTKPSPQDKSILDDLFRQSLSYRDTDAFAETLAFSARFRDYSPFNNMLVRVQNPACSFYATARDWEKRFDRQVKEDENPMLILAPMRPVMLVYDLDQTEGPELPAHIRNFATAVGALEPARIPNTVENAHRHGIEVQFKSLSSTLGGFATTKRHDRSRYKMRIVIHDKLDDQSRYAVLCHELAHILLGHLGTDDDRWWPCRLDLSRSAVEIEAESVAFMVAARLSLKTASTAYLATYATDGKIPDSVSLDLVTRVTGKVYEMGDIIRSAPRKRQSKPRKSGQ